jgi:hypothetical protein
MQIRTTDHVRTALVAVGRRVGDQHAGIGEELDAETSMVCVDSMSPRAAASRIAAAIELSGRCVCAVVRVGGGHPQQAGAGAAGSGVERAEGVEVRAAPIEQPVAGGLRPAERIGHLRGGEQLACRSTTFRSPRLGAREPSSSRVRSLIARSEFCQEFSHSIRVATWRGRRELTV